MLTSANTGYVATIKSQRATIDVMRKFIRELDEEIKDHQYNVITLEYYLAIRAKYFSNLN